MKPLLIIKAGEKLSTLQHVAGDYEDWILSGMGWAKENSIIVSVYKDEKLPGNNDICGVIITGSEAMVMDNSQWIKSCANWLQNIVRTKLPVLGICFGHQLLAYALGGEVRDNPMGIEVGSVTMELLDTEDDALFCGSTGSFDVQVSHQQSVTSLPAGAQLLAKTAMDANHAFRFGGSAWGIQFHPEFDRTIVEKHIEYFQQQTDNNIKLNPVTETPLATTVLQRFAKLIKQQ